MTTPQFAVRGKPANTRPASQQRTTQEIPLPAPRTINAAGALAGMAPTDCLYTYNLMPTEYGMRTRQGYAEWAIGFADPVRTILPFIGDLENQTNDRLFACNSEGIYDISITGAVGAAAFTWATTGDTAGYGVYTHYTNDAGEHYLMLADEKNGLHEYEEATGVWSASTGLTGVDPTKVFFVMAHQQRLWMIEQDSSDAWYLPTGAKAGEAKKFNFGSQFREGGNLVGLYSWTVDGGDGVDDYLVGVSREGGVAIYRGSDPANASTWALVGVWYIGRVPAGHRIASQYGGELFVLSQNGLININRLLKGASLAEAATAATDMITRLVRNDIARTLENRGWEIRILPGENQFIINTPLLQTASHIGYVQDLTTLGWGMWRGLPMATGDIYQGELYFADEVDSVWLYTGERDAAEPSKENPGVDIEFSMLTSFQGGGRWLRGQLCRPHFVAQVLPSFNVQARWNFDFDENSGALPAAEESGAALWDTAVWDEAVWSGNISGTTTVRGISGYGQYLAIAIKGKAPARLQLVALTVMASNGDIL